MAGINACRTIIGARLLQNSGSRTSQLNMQRHIGTTLPLSEKTSGRFKVSRKHNNPLTYEEAHKPHEIAHIKAWNSMNTESFPDFGIRPGKALTEDVFIRRFLTCTWHDLFVSEILIKRQANMIRVGGIVQRKILPRKMYFLIGYSEELLSHWIQCPVKLELQTVDDKKDVIFKYKPAIHTAAKYFFPHVPPFWCSERSFYFDNFVIESNVNIIMPVFKSGDYEIQFPFEPYDVQKALMDKVIECLESRENGLLESPTGTGKTLSLLCASIAWQRKQKSSIQANRANQPFPELFETPFQSVFGKKNANNNNNNNAQAVFSVPKIIYSSRTHSQLSQAIQELKRSFYKDAKAIVLGSRDLLCVHEEVSRLPTSSAKIMACHIRVQHHTCGYYNNLSTKKDELLIRDQSVVDIEDIVRRGKANRFCPFFMSRDLVQEAEVVFMPYNYLLDPKLRSSHGIDLKNCVIILDEGHNVAKICEDAVSFEIKSTIIAQCIQELTKALNEFSEITQQGTEKALAKDLSLGSIIRLKQSFLQLEEELDKIKTNDEGTILPGQQLLSILFQNGFPPSSLTAAASDLDSISTFLTGKSQDATGCDKFGSVLRILSSQSMFRNPTVFGESYKVFVQHEESKRLNSDIRSYSSTKSAKAKVFHFWCFNPAVGLENMMLYGPRCIVLASGTLSPMPFLQKELQIPFQVQLSNPHIIKDNQLLARVVTKGPENIRLSSSYQNRNDKNYLKSLGELIRQVCAVVPKGVLVFFPSYSVMEICKREWESTGLWNRMEQSKKILFEPRGKDNFKQTMDDYYAAVKSSSGACLMAVCRGKVSEGLDFTDDNGRAVIITGIPYSPARDPHVLAKQQYLNNKISAGEKQCVSGAGWYQMEATRALNQAIGRIIRHVHDFGAILLCDERCAAGNVQQNLSGWVHDRIKTSDSFGDTIRDLSHFFGSSVQKERNELAKSMVRSTRQVSQTAKAPSGTIETAYQTPSAQELEDIYGSSECQVEFSQARKNELSSSSQSQHVASSSQIKSRPRKHIKMTLEDLNTPVSSSKLVDFNAPVPVYPKPFAAFSQTTSPSSSTSWFQKPQKKKIKLASRNNAFSGASSSSSSALNQPQTSSEPLVNGRERSVVEFSTNDEFWAWVKVAAGARQGKFVRALKSFQASKDVQSLANELTAIFTSEYRKQLVGGLSGRKLISADAAKQLDLIICS